MSAFLMVVILNLKKKKKNDGNCYTTKIRFPTFIYGIPLTER